MAKRVIVLLIPILLIGCEPSEKEVELGKKPESTQVKVTELTSLNEKTKAELHTQASLVKTLTEERDKSAEKLSAHEEALAETKVALVKFKAEFENSSKEIESLKSQLDTAQSNLRLALKAKEEELAKRPKEPISVVDFQVGLTFENGNVKTVPNTEFAILSKNLFDIAKETNCKGWYTPFNNSYSGTEYTDLAYMFQMDSSRDKGTATEMGKLIQGMKKASVQTFRTDLGGISKIKGLAPGKYFIVGSTAIAVGAKKKSYVLWDFPCEITKGENLIVLDATNAAGVNTF
jgi:hypothetical protein